MEKVLYVLIAVAAFGLLIAAHEFGHFIAAKLCGVRVNEFAIGMGPCIVSRERGETLYSLRALPIGGYCAMEGEDEDSDDPRAFECRPLWQRLVILAAGSFMNFLVGLLVVILIYAGASGFGGTTVVDIADGFKYGGENGLMMGDTIHSIDGSRIYYTDDFSTYMSRSVGSVDMVVIRDGKKVELSDYGLRKEYYDVNGESVLKYGVYFNSIAPSAVNNLKYSFYVSYDFVRSVWLGLGDIFRGRAGVNDLTGVVGIVDTISDVGSSAATANAAVRSIAYICAFIAVNLAVMNMLPIPALDGGRVFTITVTAVIELILGRKLDPKYERWIHTAGLTLLLALMAYVMLNDILRIFRG